LSSKLSRCVSSSSTTNMSGREPARRTEILAWSRSRSPGPAPALGPASTGTVTLPSRLNRRRASSIGTATLPSRQRCDDEAQQGEQDFSFFSVWGDGVDFGLISHFSEGNDMLVSVVSTRLDVRLLLRPSFVRASSGRSPRSSLDADFGRDGGRASSGGSPRSSPAIDFGRAGDMASSGGFPAADFGWGSDRASSGGSPCSSSAADFGRGSDRASSGGSPRSSPAADFGRSGEP
jgi:hypothetical protein